MVLHIREMHNTMFYTSRFTTEGEIFIVENMLFSRLRVYKNEKVMSLFFQELMVHKRVEIGMQTIVK